MYTKKYFWEKAVIKKKPGSYDYDVLFDRTTYFVPYALLRQAYTFYVMSETGLNFDEALELKHYCEFAIVRRRFYGHGIIRFFSSFDRAYNFCIHNDLIFSELSEFAIVPVTYDAQKTIKEKISSDFFGMNEQFLYYYNHAFTNALIVPMLRSLHYDYQADYCCIEEPLLTSK